VFHMFPAGSSLLLRMWDRENWVKLAEEVYNTYGYKVLFSGGKEDIPEADPLVKVLKEKQVDSAVIAGKFDLNEMKNVLKYAQFLVSVNTGIMHMGAAVGVPLIALHGATSVRRWGPLSEKAYNVWTHEPCQPCISLGFESKCVNPVCMKHITVEMVMHYVNRVEKDKKYGYSQVD
jgi:heptosyltransferase III